MRHLLPIILLLSIAMRLQAQGLLLQNPSFEDTMSTPSGTVPANWTTSGFGFGFTSDAYEGSRAIQVWNWYYYGKGYVVNGNALGLGMGGGAPISTTCGLSGYYKYTPGLNGGATDSAEVQLLLFRNPGPSVFDRDTLYWGTTRLGPASTYTLFEVIPSEGPGGTMPDSFVVSIISSVNGFCDTSSSGDCLYLTVDALDLLVPAGREVPLNLEAEAGLYPNPATGLLRVRLPAGHAAAQLEILALDGRLLSTQAVAFDGQALDRGSLPAGTYGWRLTDASGSLGSGRVILH